MAKPKVKTNPEKSVNISPLQDRVLVKPEDAETGSRKTDAGIYLPESVKEDKGGKVGRVVAVGPGRTEEGKLVAVSVKPGQKVLYSWGDIVKHDGEEYVLVRETDILAVLK